MEINMEVMKLKIMDPEKQRSKILVKRCFQDTIHGMKNLYYETLNDEHGQGTFLKISTIQC